jgi:hypothetical protein
MVVVVLGAVIVAAIAHNRSSAGSANHPALAAITGQPSQSSSGTSGASNPAPSVPASTPSETPFTDAAGHFRASFAATPTLSSVQFTNANLGFVVNVASTTEPPVELVEALDSNQAIPAAQLSTVLTSALSSVATFGQDTLVAQTPTTVDGYTAVQASFTQADGSPISAVAIGYSSTRLYLILAPTGPAFTSLRASFTPLP